MHLPRRTRTAQTARRLRDPPTPPRGLTGAVPELEAQVGASEAIDGDGQLDHLAPARAVVVVEDKGAILAAAGLAAAQTDAVLRAKRDTERSVFGEDKWVNGGGG